MGLRLPPTIALLLTVGFIIFLFRRDFREQSNVTSALWLPLIWMFITFTRALSEWLYILFGVHLGAVSLEEGSPLDATFYLTLIVAGMYVLNKRHVQLSKIVQNNGWLMVFLLYCLISILWSDFPFVAFKRWIKVLGHPVMVLLILTEPDPEEALIRLMKRCAYVFVLGSILFIKYYPDWGRSFDIWVGTPSNNGLAGDKNALGHDSLILGYFFFWQSLNTWRTEPSIGRRKELLLDFSFLVMIGWLMLQAHSSTSMVSLVVGSLTMGVIGLRRVNRRLVGTYLIAGVLVWIVAEMTFGISGLVIHFLGKDPTLTTRTLLWQELLRAETNPILGTGFESFWLGDRLKALWERHWWQPNEAHNGYLETYLNLGLVGLFLLIGLIVATFWKIRGELLTNLRFGRFRLGLLLAIVLYNWTEASFKTTSAMWFAFYIIAMDYPQPFFTAIESPSELVTSEEETDFAYSRDVT